MSDDTKPKPLTRAHAKLIDAAVLIYGEAATKNERGAILNALSAHHLIEVKDNGTIQVTGKGLEYQQWRGALPPLPPATALSAPAIARLPPDSKKNL